MSSAIRLLWNYIFIDLRRMQTLNWITSSTRLPTIRMMCLCTWVSAPKQETNIQWYLIRIIGNAIVSKINCSVNPCNTNTYLINDHSFSYLWRSCSSLLLNVSLNSIKTLLPVKYLWNTWCQTILLRNYCNISCLRFCQVLVGWHSLTAITKTVM